MFDKDAFQFDDSIEEFIQAVFKDIDARTQEQIVKRATVAHQMLYTDKKDYVFMCMELLLTVLICAYKDNSCFLDNPIKLDRSEKMYANIFVSSEQTKPPAFGEFFQTKYDNIYFKVEPGFSDEATKYILPKQANLYCAVLFNWYWMHKRHPRVVFVYYKDGEYESIARHHAELKKFAETIKTLK